MIAIDVHHHYVPKQLIDEAKRHGKALGVEISEVKGSWALSFAGSKPHRLQPTIFDVEKHIEVMDRGQIRLATLEANTNSLGYRLNGEQGEGWCNLYNDCAHELAKARPDRFIGMAVVPLQDGARAAKVLDHAIIDLKFRAAFIGSNVNGQYYNSKEFDSFWAKAQELGILIVMHPEHIAGAERMTEFGLNAVCGNPADSTLSLGYMLYSGLFDRFPNLKLCALHGGGFLPYHLGRFDREFESGKKVRPAPAKNPPSGYLKNLYFDTLVYDVDTLEYLKAKVGTDKLMLGTDYPYTLGDWMGVEKIQALKCSDADKDAILEGNARRLLQF
ncbi:MAG TPA: amidohydrolase family protein [Candidatus Limnocylindrales bacterium]|nr:amidohydrolase family protein [Candidatus Limnocylindrales bacterium]